MAEPVPVRLSADSDVAAKIAAVAARMGMEVDVTEEGETEGGVGADVAGLHLPPDAPEWQVEAALLRALAPTHLLFLCVANSARSQMAEGLARAMAPSGVKISSAGSEPTRVRPQAIAALGEVGIDISHHESIGVDAVERPVAAVITLCAEEVCPVWLEPASRLHWGLPDPAGASEDPAEEMDAFRSVRDELTRRFEVLFSPA